MVDVSTGQNNITITVTPTSTTSEVTISSGGTSASAGVNYGAEIYAERAKTYATQAGTSATLAGEAENNSEIWAEGTDAEVQELGGVHSSKGWAEEASAGGADRSLSNLNSTGEAHFQAPLVSGANIKTINNNSIVGSGNVDIDALPSQSGQSGKYLTTDGSSASWSIISLSLSELSDATISAPLNDQVLKYDSAASKWINGESANSLVDLTDVQISQLANNDIIIYNSTDAKFKNVASPVLSASYLQTSYVSGTSGYNIWSNGYCEQWGRIGEGTTSGYPNYTITLTKTYSNTNFNVMVTGRYPSSTGNGTSYCYSVSTNSISITSVGYGSYWKTSGYLAEGQY